jgi:hypothetical protein
MAMLHVELVLSKIWADQDSPVDINLFQSFYYRLQAALQEKSAFYRVDGGVGDLGSNMICFINKENVSRILFS